MFYVFWPVSPEFDLAKSAKGHPPPPQFFFFLLQLLDICITQIAKYDAEFESIEKIAKNCTPIKL